MEDLNKAVFISIALMAMALPCFVFAQSSSDEVVQLFQRNDGLGSQRKACAPKASAAPSLMILGENHIDSGDQARKEALIQRAVKGDIFLGLEGYVYDDSSAQSFFKHEKGADENSRVFGIQESFSRAVVNRVSSHGALTWAMSGVGGYAENLQEHKAAFFWELLSVPESRQALRAIRKDYEGTDIAPVIDNILNTEDPFKDGIQELAALKKSNLYQDNEKILALSRRVSDALVEKADTPYMRQKYQTPDLRAAYAFLKNPMSPTLEAQFHQEVNSAWTEQQMAARILKLYEQARREGKECEIIVGESHAEPIRKILETRGLRIL